MVPLNATRVPILLFRLPVALYVFDNVMLVSFFSKKRMRKNEVVVMKSSNAK